LAQGIAAVLVTVRAVIAVTVRGVVGVAPLARAFKALGPESGAEAINKVVAYILSNATYLDSAILGPLLS